MQRPRVSVEIIKNDDHSRWPLLVGSRFGPFSGRRAAEDCLREAGWEYSPGRCLWLIAGLGASPTVFLEAVVRDDLGLLDPSQLPKSPYCR